MAGRAKTTKTEKAKKLRPTQVKSHLRDLGLDTQWLYESWCRDHGFAPNFEKSKSQLREELIVRQTQLKRVASEARIHNNPKRIITDVCEGRIKPHAIRRPEWKAFCESIASSRPDKTARRQLQELLLFVHDKADFLFETTNSDGKTTRYVDALVKLNDRRGSWIRPLETWAPQSHNNARQFASLLRHLLARYAVPAFMDQAWLNVERGSWRFRDWFVHLGQGRNIRTANTPFPLTKKMAHSFLEAPEDYSVEAALRWGQVHGLGGDRRLVSSLLGSRLGTSFENYDFWTSVIRFFIANPMLDRSHVGPIIDFLDHQKFRTQEVLVGPGQVEVIPPPQPNLSMKGRTAGAMLAQIDEWHGALRKARAGAEEWFRPSGYKGLRKRTGKDDAARTWIIRELLSTSELVNEGRVMRHCVASYAQSCIRGYCSIWTLERESKSGMEKRQTIEVRADGTIVQCRGRSNVLPTAAEMAIISEWADGAGLQISRYLSAAA